MSEWQPIETAPKDGRDLWLFAPGDEPQQVVGFWVSEDGGYWCYRERLVADAISELIATHWMPLPLPPSTL